MFVFPFSSFLFLFPPTFIFPSLFSILLSPFYSLSLAPISFLRYSFLCFFLSSPSISFPARIYFPPLTESFLAPFLCPIFSLILTVTHIHPLPSFSRCNPGMGRSGRIFRRRGNSIIHFSLLSNFFSAQRERSGNSAL